MDTGDSYEGEAGDNRHLRGNSRYDYNSLPLQGDISAMDVLDKSATQRIQRYSICHKNSKGYRSATNTYKNIPAESAGCHSVLYIKDTEREGCSDRVEHSWKEVRCRDGSGLSVCDKCGIIQHADSTRTICKGYTTVTLRRI